MDQYWSVELQYRLAGRTGIQIQVRSDQYVGYEIKFSDRQEGLPVSCEICTAWSMIENQIKKKIIGASVTGGGITDD